MSEILFRASGIAALMTEGRGTVLTENQAKTLASYEERIATGGKALTPNQEKEFEDFKRRRDAPPTLSDTAKRYIEQMWLMNKKGFYKQLDNRYVQKGLFGEDTAIGLISQVEDSFYVKNTERVTKGNITGECDINVKKNSIKIIKDAKNSWDPSTFMAGDLNPMYEWQGRTYLYLYDADEFHLHYTLTDCPDHLYENEVWKLKNKYNIIDIEDESVKPLFDQLRRNLIFSDNPAYTPEERVKTFKITRCPIKEQALLDKIQPAIEYYNSITLNQI